MDNTDIPSVGSKRSADDNVPDLSAHVIAPHYEAVQPPGNTTSDDKPRRSKFVGVSWNSRNQKWIVQICIDGKQMYLGSYQEEEEAAHVYDNYALMHGHSRRLNFRTDMALKTTGAKRKSLKKEATKASVASVSIGSFAAPSTTTPLAPMGLSPFHFNQGATALLLPQSLVAATVKATAVAMPTAAASVSAGVNPTSNQIYQLINNNVATAYLSTQGSQIFAADATAAYAAQLALAAATNITAAAAVSDAAATDEARTEK
mmetsp:Transcript_44101/g.86857  ORF Transcript_44101/g.86857 Transcript_44101/m.86857 type:complete len:260 (-) Transcript_44101:41-820(-)